MSNPKIRASKSPAAAKATTPAVKTAVTKALKPSKAYQNALKAVTGTQAPATPVAPAKAPEATKAVTGPSPAANESQATKATPAAAHGKAPGAANESQATQVAAPKTDSSNVTGILRVPNTHGGGWSAHDCQTLEEGQRLYRRLQNGAQGKLDTAEYYRNGLKVATINKRGVALDLNGAILADAPTLEEARTALDAKPAEALEPAQSVLIDPASIAAVLSVAAKKDQARPYLSSVYLHQVEDQLRIVATDGHRILILSQPLKGSLNWGTAGVMIPRAELDRIAKFIGKGTEEEPATIEVSYGRNHQHIVISAVGDIGTFKVTPQEGQFVDYRRTVEKVRAFNGGERKPTEATCINPAYMKAAGAIAATLGSTGVYAFMESGSEPCAFTFHDVPGAVLIQMPIRQDKPEKALAVETIRLLGDSAMRGSIAALKAHATRCRKQIEATKDKAEIEKLQTQEKGFLSRAAELQTALAVKVEYKGDTKMTTVPDAPKEKVTAVAAAK